jgi:hypothetical protein
MHAVTEILACPKAAAIRLASAVAIGAIFLPGAKYKSAAPEKAACGKLPEGQRRARAQRARVPRSAPTLRSSALRPRTSLVTAASSAFSGATCYPGTGAIHHRPIKVKGAKSASSGSGGRHAKGTAWCPVLALEWVARSCRRSRHAVPQQALCKRSRESCSSPP